MQLKGIPVYTEVSSFQGEWNRGVQKCPKNRDIQLYIEVSSFRWIGFYCIQLCCSVVSRASVCHTYLLLAISPLGMLQ